MSQPQSEEPDPLLAFFMEPAPADPPIVPAETALQPAVTSAVPPTPSPASIEIPPSVERFDRIEQALDQSKEEILALTSHVATLVGAIADINKQMSRPAARQVHARSPFPRPRHLTVSAVASVIIGLGLGVATWQYWSSRAATITAPIARAAMVEPPAPVAIAAPIAPAAMVVPSAPATVAAPPADHPIARTVSKAPPVIAAKQVSGPATPAVKPIKYVGTLSIDSTPGGEVFIDRKTAGRTPLRVPDLRAGSHLIWVEREGFRRWTRVVQVPADRVSRVSVELEPIAPR